VAKGGYQRQRLQQKKPWELLKTDRDEA